MAQLKRPRGYTDQYWREQGLLLLGASPGAARCASDTFELYKKLKRALLKWKGPIHTPAVSATASPSVADRSHTGGYGGGNAASRGGGTE